jgi:chromosome partitioning protein
MSSRLPTTRAASARRSPRSTWPRDWPGRAPTLLVDVDAQAHTTLWWVEDPGEVAADLQDAIARGTPVDSIILPTRIGRLDLLPATLALARLELDLMSMVRREDRE